MNGYRDCERLNRAGEWAITWLHGVFTPIDRISARSPHNWLIIIEIEERVPLTSLFFIRNSNEVWVRFATEAFIIESVCVSYFDCGSSWGHCDHLPASNTMMIAGRRWRRPPCPSRHIFLLSNFDSTQSVPEVKPSPLSSTLMHHWWASEVIWKRNQIVDFN